VNSLDRVIGYFAPERALARLRARAMITEGRRAYEAAKRDRFTEGWNRTVSGNSANAENGPAYAITRDRARELVRNNPYAGVAVRKLAAHIVGKGINPTAKSEDEPRRAVLRQNWEAFVENADLEGRTNFYGLQNLVVRTVVESGEALIRWYQTDPDIVGTPLQCEVLEPDYIDTARNDSDLAAGRYIVQGIEFDRFGRRVAYWLFDRHPGDMALQRGIALQSKRVAAEEIEHVFDRVRAQQIRGVTWFAPVATDMRDVDDYDFAERLRKKVAACFSVFIQRDDMSDPVAIGATTSDTYAQPGASTSRTMEIVQPGTINYLRRGETPTFASPPRSEGYGDYMVMQLMAIAAGIGIPYHVMTGDLRQANYSSLREGKLDFWQLLDNWQLFMVVPQVCAPAWRKSHMAWAKSLRDDRLAPRVFSQPEWMMPRRPWVDPLKDGEAEALELKLGLKSYPMAERERGLTPEEVYDQNKKWIPMLKEIGIDQTQAGAAKPAVDPSTDNQGTTANDQAAAA
jgi:lambda family phage portal protein